MLPTQKTPPKSDLRDLSVLLYGAHKSGKSELCSQADHALFLATEPGLNHLDVYQIPISTWDEILLAAKEIAAGQHDFRTIIIDTVDNAYRMCADYVCAKFKIAHESDLEYGKGYALVNAEFHRVINKLALLPYGLFLVSHAQEKEVQTRTGKHTKTIPTLPDKARKLVLGLVDIILFADLEAVTGSDVKPAYRRVLRTKPSATYEAGDRTRRLPETIDFSFAAFAEAFAHGRRLPNSSSSAATAAATGTSGTATNASADGAAAPGAATGASDPATNASASAGASAALSLPHNQPLAPARAPTASRDPTGGTSKAATAPSRPATATATAPRTPPAGNR